MHSLCHFWLFHKRWFKTRWILFIRVAKYLLPIISHFLIILLRATQGGRACYFWFFFVVPKGTFFIFFILANMYVTEPSKRDKDRSSWYYRTKFRHTMNEWFFSPFYSFSKTMKMMLWAKHCRHTNVGSLCHMCWDPCMSKRQWDRRWLWRPDNPTKHHQPVPSNTSHSFRYVIANGICEWYHPSTAGTTTGSVHHGHWSMFDAKTLDKTLGWLKQNLAHDLAPNMVKLLCMYLIWFSMQHGIKTDSMFFVKTGMLFCINYFASNIKKPI